MYVRGTQYSLEDFSMSSEVIPLNSHWQVCVGSHPQPLIEEHQRPVNLFRIFGQKNFSKIFIFMWRNFYDGKAHYFHQREMQSKIVFVVQISHFPCTKTVSLFWVNLAKIFFAWKFLQRAKSRYLLTRCFPN